jgi:hypothetical protein
MARGSSRRGVPSRGPTAGERRPALLSSGGRTEDPVGRHVVARHGAPPSLRRHRHDLGPGPRSSRCPKAPEAVREPGQAPDAAVVLLDPVVQPAAAAVAREAPELPIPLQGPFDPDAKPGIFVTRVTGPGSDGTPYWRAGGGARGGEDGRDETCPADRERRGAGVAAPRGRGRRCRATDPAGRGHALADHERHRERAADRAAPKGRAARRLDLRHRAGRLCFRPVRRIRQQIRHARARTIMGESAGPLFRPLFSQQYPCGFRTGRAAPRQAGIDTRIASGVRAVVPRVALDPRPALGPPGHLAGVAAGEPRQVAAAEVQVVEVAVVQAAQLAQRAAVADLLGDPGP